LPRELIWIAKRIAREAVTINEFREQAHAIELLVERGRLAEAISSIKALTAKLGETYWALQLRIALEQLSGGLDAQKRYVSEVREVQRDSVLGFVAYYTGVRNEERTTWRRFLEMVEDRLSEKKLQEYRHYLRYRLTLEWPSTSIAMADILRTEQSHHILDLYETFVRAMQNIVMSEELIHLRPHAADALSGLHEIRDFRLDKLALSIDPPIRSPDIPIRSTLTSDALFQGKFVESLKAYRRLTVNELLDPWQTIYASMASIRKRGKSARSTRGMRSRPSIASVVSRESGAVTSFSLLEKLANNLSHLTSWAGVRTFAISLRPSQGVNFPASMVCLNSPYFGVEDLDIIPDALRGALNESYASVASGITGETWRPLLQDSIAASQSDLQRLASSVRHARRGDFTKAIEELSPLYDTTEQEALRFLAAKLMLECEVAIAHTAEVIELIAEQAARNETNASFLPVSEALGNLSWADFKPHAMNLSAGIALEALWHATDNDSVATMLRFAFSFQLRHSGFERPSAFVDGLDKFERRKLVHYLRKICVPAIMDMCPAFGSSREVLEERRSICAALKIVDPESADEYDAEIFHITNELVIAEGLRLVDSSRIHVDTASITRWAVKNLEEDYARCSDLVRAGIGVSSNFDEAIREALAKAGARQVFFTPGDQADTILADIFARLRDEFLSNSDYGLDYFLSKRVRHQSFIGLVRGPLEFAHLITTRESEFGPYRRNDNLLDSLKSLPVPQLDSLSSVLSTFAERFDGLLVELKNKKIQIRSETHPDGLFDVPITNHTLVVVRSVMQTGIPFEDFLRLSYAIFWGLLERNLEEARIAISDTLKTQVTSLFDGLKQQLREIAELDPEFPKLSAAIGDVSVEVQRSLDSAAAWFSRPEGQQASHKFTLRQSLDIAVQSAQKSHRAFDPELTIEVNGDAQILVQDLLLITDAVFIALDNVKGHSGLKKPSTVHIDCSLDSSGKALKLIIRNTINPKIRNRETEDRLAQLRTRINSRILGGTARTEGGSGFLKLAAALQQSAEGSLEFGFTETDEFCVVLNLRLTQLTYAVLAE
jgi:hypothetical protein